MKKEMVSLAASAALSLSFVGCGSSDDSSSASASAAAVAATKVEFVGMQAPSKFADMNRTYSQAKVRVYTTDTDFKEYPLSYNVLFGVKDKVGTNPNPAGQVYNYKMAPVMDPYGEPVVAETPDANSLLNIDGSLYMVSHLEYDWLLSSGAAANKTANWYSRMPMNMILTDISQSSDGSLKAVDQKPIDHSSVNGGWIFCFGSQTPWNTHLGGEEDYDLYFTAASGATSLAKTTAGLKAMSEIYFDSEKTANPYHYGYQQEVVVKKDGSYDLHKRYAMGKGTWEMAKVMGDKRTAIFGDDGTNVFLMMFVADTAEDLSAGTLYAAKWNQTSADGATDGGSATLGWVKLGHATEAEVEGWANTHTFEDIFEYVTPEAVALDPSAATGYTAIKAGHTGIEYLKLKAGKESVAAFLEPRRYAALKGATTEFNKMEGIAIDEKDKKAYIAMSYIDKGMLLDGSFATDDIRIAKNNCGGTYELTLQSGQTDTDGNAINSAYVGTSMLVPAALLGEEIATDAYGNTCNPDKIANTDNVFFSEKMRTLFIGEDSGTHANNFVWAYNVDTKKLDRILSVTSGGESTGLQVLDNQDGHAYIMSNSQHHGDFINTMPTALKDTLAPNIDKFNASFGYIGGMPGLK
jgi:secreted PhoX family phosphatase